MSAARQVSITTADAAKAAGKKAQAKVKQGEFFIASLLGREIVKRKRHGYLLGDLAAHKEKGPKVYFWTITHLPTGIDISPFPPAENKEQALRTLQDLHVNGIPDTKRYLLNDHARIESLRLVEDGQ